MKRILSVLLIILIAHASQAQNVGIGTNVPMQKLDVIGKIRSSTLTGVGNRFVMADPTGTLNVSSSGLLDSTAWLTLGNSSIDTTKNFLGTLTNTHILFKTNGNAAANERMRIRSGGEIVVNNTSVGNNNGDVFSAYATGSTNGISGALSPIGAYALNGYSATTGIGVSGANAGTGIGVWGSSSSGYGTVGFSGGNTAFAGMFQNSNANGTGLLVTGNNLAGTYLVNGSAGSFRGTNFGIINFSNISSAAVAGSAVWGSNRKTVITSFLGGAGVTGIDSANGSGVIGVSFYGGFEGVTGIGSSNSGTGVLGQAGMGPSPRAVWGDIATVSGTNATSIAVVGSNNSVGANAVGVYGQEVAAPNGPARYAILANGDMAATGTKPFVIDHPLDPSGKFLKHFSMESNEVLNYYRGNVILDANGEATIQLPSYFNSINNTNYNYNLTPIGAPAQLYVKSEVSGNNFVISGGIAGMKVSWTLTAERNDPYLQQNPDSRLVELVKTGDAAGKYLVPSLYGQPESAGIYYKPSPQKTAVNEKSKDAPLIKSRDFTQKDVSK
ncbi:MAG TPA: hypothetical protein PLX94_06460 [Bacteroidia bacterium]|nr:hypothetical protein [Bacteroidia bacterium]